MASKEAERYWQSLCENVGTAINEFSKYSLMEAFDAGVASIPNNTELVDELQALREEMKLLKDKSEWHNPEELPIQQGDEVKGIFLTKFTMNHSDRVHVGCSFFNFIWNKWTFPVDVKFQDTVKLISWKEIN